MQVWWCAWIAVLFGMIRCGCASRASREPEPAARPVEPHEPGHLPVLHALLWRATQPDATWQQEEFDRRVPRLMAWLERLHDAGQLVACGGGGYEDRAGGLTIVRAKSVEEAQELARQSPMNEIGSTELFVWDVFHGDLYAPHAWPPRSTGPEAPAAHP